MKRHFFQGFVPKPVQSLDGLQNRRPGVFTFKCMRNLEIALSITAAKPPHFVDMDNSILQVVRDHLAIDLTNQVKDLLLLVRPVSREFPFIQHIGSSVIVGHFPQVPYPRDPARCRITFEDEPKLPVWFGFERIQDDGICCSVSSGLSSIFVAIDTLERPQLELAQYTCKRSSQGSM